MIFTHILLTNTYKIVTARLINQDKHGLSNSANSLASTSMKRKKKIKKKVFFILNTLIDISMSAKDNYKWTSMKDHLKLHDPIDVCPPKAVLALNYFNPLVLLELT